MTVATVAKISYKSLILLVGDPANKEKNREFFNFGLARGSEVAIRPMIQVV
jgi:hypothetical protein